MRLTSAASLFALVVEAAAAAKCSAKTFTPKSMGVFGIEIQDIYVAELKDYEWFSPDAMPAALPLIAAPPKALNLCNVTVTYTHPGLETTVRTVVWLPLEQSSWNGRFLGQGGSGYAAGNEGSLSPAVALGYAAAYHDGGHSIFGDTFTNSLDSSWWGLKSPGNVDMNQLHNLGHRTLEEFSQLAKQITEQYYDKKIDYSYWNGCSTGGRQGMVLAQRYPSLYQGILAVAPSFNWVTFLVTEFWPHVIMQELNYYPAPCELNAITRLAIESCDELDGVKDDIVSAPDQCTFDPKSVIGTPYDCEGSERKISKEAAQIAAETWSGPTTNDGTPVWFGLTHDTSLPGIDPLFGGLASTTCSPKNQDCKSRPFPISADWIKTWLLKDPTASLTTITRAEFFHLLRLSRQQYTSAIDSADPDLAPFASTGGKLISWHGLQDQLIPPNGTTNYYERVASALHPTTPIETFYRHFAVPGIAHCLGGAGPYPLTALDSLVAWVEKGQEPASLAGVNLPFPGQDAETFVQMTRPICAWPKIAKWTGKGSVNDAENFVCRHGFGGRGEEEGGGRDEL